MGMGTVAMVTILMEMRNNNACAMIKNDVDLLTSVPTFISISNKKIAHICNATWRCHFTAFLSAR